MIKNLVLPSNILPSAFFLTLLLAVGLFFFIRASVKDRIETAVWSLAKPEDQVLQEVTHYLESRTYRLESVDREQDQAIFTGLVSASLGLAIFLSALAAVGALCIALVLMVQFPQLGYWSLGIVVFAPLAGWFYFKKAQRPEQVILTVRPAEVGQQTCLWVKAHRDEIAALQTSLHLAG